MADEGQRDPMNPGSYGGWSAVQAVVAEGYSLDPAGLKHLADEFEAIAVMFEKTMKDAQIIAQTEQPGLDYASGNNAETFRNSGSELLATLDARVRYCRDQAAKYRAAMGKYQVAEDTHAADVSKAGGHL